MLCELFSFVQECDIPNWLTMAIELTIGGLVGIVFFIIQHKQGMKLQKIIDEQEDFRKKKRRWTIEQLKFHLIKLKGSLEGLDVYLLDYRPIANSTMPLNDERMILEEFVNDWEYQKESHIDKLESISNQSSDVIEPNILVELRDILTKSSEKYSAITNEGQIQFNYINYKEIMKMIDELMDKILILKNN